nr:hypothetical protein BJQ95_03660 [Cryobacterium sp. SO1]
MPGGGALNTAPGHIPVWDPRPKTYWGSASRSFSTSASESAAHGEPSGFAAAASGLSPWFHHLLSYGTLSKRIRAPFS